MSEFVDVLYESGIPHGIVGSNRFNPFDSNVMLNYYIESTDGIAYLSNAGATKYHLSGYIPVKPGVTYRKSSNSGPIGYFDRNLVWLSGVLSPGNTFTPPSGASYVRLSIPRTAWSSFYVIIDGESAVWTPYGNRPANVPTNPLNIGFMRKSKHLLMKRLLPSPESARVIFNCAGDSYTHNASRWTKYFAEYMVAKYGDGGGGWCGFSYSSAGTPPYGVGNQPSSLNGNVRAATYPTLIFATPIASYASKNMPDISALTLAATGQYAFQAFPALPVHNGIDLFFEGTTDGVVKYRHGTYVSGAVDDPASYSWGSNTNINLQGTVGATQIADIKTGMTSGAGAVIVEWVSGTSIVSGVNLKSTANGVVVNKIAASGSQANSWYSRDATNWQTGIAALGGDVFIYMDGPNSQSSTVTPATWGAYVETIMTRVRVALPGSDILVVTPPENQRTDNRISILSYQVEAVARAIKNRYTFLDLQTAFGDGGNATEYGSAGIIPLFNADLLHPEPATGGRLMLKEFLRTIEPLST
jgi:hypothetical protein